MVNGIFTLSLDNQTAAAAVTATAAAAEMSWKTRKTYKIGIDIETIENDIKWYHLFQNTHKINE